MKRSKSERKEALMDALVELVVTVVLFGLGALVLALFDIDLGAVDGDGIMLIGVGMIALLGGVVWVVEILKKKNKPSDKQDDDSGI